MASIHHTFSTQIAEKYKSVDIAILIHHFQYWITHNAKTGRNFHEGRTWSFNSIQDIAAYFPYWSRQQVERLLVKAVELKILKKGNFNKSRFDRTVWYAFENEEDFAISRNRDMEISKSRDHDLEIETPIPYSNPSSNQDITPISPSGNSPPSSEQKAKDLSDYLQKIILAQKPNFTKKPTPKWNQDMGTLLRLRDESQIKSLISWALKDSFWASNIQSPGALLKHLDKLEMKMNQIPSSGPKVDRRQFREDGSDANPELNNLF